MRLDMTQPSIEDRLAKMLLDAEEAETVTQLRSIFVEFLELYAEDRYAGESKDDEYDPYEHDDE